MYNLDFYGLIIIAYVLCVLSGSMLCVVSHCLFCVVFIFGWILRVELMANVELLMKGVMLNHRCGAHCFSLSLSVSLSCFLYLSYSLLTSLSCEHM